jgi:hypothetical protein
MCHAERDSLGGGHSTGGRWRLLALLTAGKEAAFYLFQGKNRIFVRWRVPDWSGFRERVLWILSRQNVLGLKGARLHWLVVLRRQRVFICLFGLAVRFCDYLWSGHIKVFVLSAREEK